MIIKRYGLFDIYTKGAKGSSPVFIKREGAFYLVPTGLEIEPYTRTGRREIIDHIYDGTIKAFIPNPALIADLGGYLKSVGYEVRSFNADAF